MSERGDPADRTADGPTDRTRDGAAGREWALPVVAVLFVVLLLAAGALVVGTFVLNTGEPPVQNVQAGASVAENRTAGTVTVAFTSNQNADYLLVRFAENDTGLRVANTSAGADATDDGVRLSDLGDRVTFAERRPSANTTVEVVVLAVDGDARTVIVARDVAV